MAVSYEGQFVVCGEHDIRHPAGARCPDCSDKTPQGVSQSPSEEVQVVSFWGEP